MGPQYAEIKGRSADCEDQIITQSSTPGFRAKSLQYAIATPELSRCHPFAFGIVPIFDEMKTTQPCKAMSAQSASRIMPKASSISRLLARYSSARPLNAGRSATHARGAAAAACADARWSATSAGSSRCTPLALAPGEVHIWWLHSSEVSSQNGHAVPLNMPAGLGI